MGSIPIVSTVGFRRSGFARGNKKIATAIGRRGLATPVQASRLHYGHTEE
jgi:hypothetical protein